MISRFPVRRSNMPRIPQLCRMIPRMMIAKQEAAPRAAEVCGRKLYFPALRSWKEAVSSILQQPPRALHNYWC